MLARSELKSRDFVTLLSIFAVTQIVLPTRYVIGPLGSAGAPAGLLALGIFVWWLMDWLLQPWPRSRVRQPLKVAVFAFLLTVLASYLVGTTRPISPEELLSSDRALLRFVGWAGLVMAAMDGISSHDRLDTLLRRLSMLGGLEAMLGILQFLTGMTFIDYLHLPGLSDNGGDPGSFDRSGFTRPSGTAIHPIEFGVTMSMLLPIALHYAVTDAGRRGFLVRWLPAGAIALSLPLSISRSAIICTAVALAICLSVWPPRPRRVVFGATAILLVCLVIAMPSLLRAIIGLFSGISQDSSALSRTGSYELAWKFIARSPVFGRGVGTFLPQYRILDNQYLGSLIELGFVGLVLLLLFFIMAIGTAWRLRRFPVLADGDPHLPSRLGPTLAAGMSSGCLSLAFFDAWGFPMIPSLLFLMIGCAGALRRLSFEGECPLRGPLVDLDA